jgi:hypothetical protein
MVSQRSLDLFDCIQVREVSVLRADPAEFCYTPIWFEHGALAVGGIVLYVIGIPFGFYRVAAASTSDRGASVEECATEMSDVEGEAAAGETAATEPNGGSAPYLSAVMKPEGAGTPLNRSHVLEPATRRQRVQLLLLSYSDEHWWFESVDLLRKFVLTTAVLLIAPNTRQQLLFGFIAAFVSLFFYLRLEPYKSALCQRVQIALLVQLTLTYATSLVYFREPGMRLISPGYYDYFTTDDILLVVLNSAAFLTLVAVLCLGAAAASRASELELVYTASGESVKLHPPHDPHGYHMFLSHSWRHAQDQAGLVKNLSRAMLPESRTFLDVDDLEDIAQLEVEIRRSDTVVIFVTRGYLASRNCRRELVEAMRLRKPLVVLQETSADHGAATAHDLHSEVDTRLLSPAEKRACTTLVGMIEAGQALEWHREEHLKHAVFSKVWLNRLLYHLTTIYALYLPLSTTHLEGAHRPQPVAGR